MIKAVRHIVPVVSALLFVGACTGSPKPERTTAPEPTPALGPGDYARAPSACPLLPVELVSPYMKKPRPESREPNETFCTIKDHDFPYSRAEKPFFLWVSLQTKSYAPDQNPGGVSADASAHRAYQAAESKRARDVPGLGDEAMIGTLASDTKYVWVRRRNLVLKLTCDGYKEKPSPGFSERESKACLGIMRRSFGRLH